MNRTLSPLDRYAPQPPPLPLPDTPLVHDVLAGTRFVTYPFVVSILILSFNRNMGGVHAVASGRWPTSPMLGATIVSTLFGWWGFPWGIVWTPISLFHLWNGGRDATKDLLAAEIGVIEARRVLKASAKPKPPASIWLVRALILFPLALFLLLVSAIVSSAVS